MIWFSEFILDPELAERREASSTSALIGPSFFSWTTIASSLVSVDDNRDGVISCGKGSVVEEFNVDFDFDFDAEDVVALVVAFGSANTANAISSAGENGSGTMMFFS